MIKSVLERYNISPVEEWENPEDFYRMVISETDYVANEILEGVATSTDYADELYCREVARQHLNGREVTQAQPLDAGLEKAGANIDYIAMMSDIELPTEV